jgi:hypothetical protein
VTIDKKENFNLSKTNADAPKLSPQSSIGEWAGHVRTTRMAEKNRTHHASGLVLCPAYEPGRSVYFVT